ncbi:MAG TPA: hypothetical protein VFM28_11995 [Nitrososphaeraceae archaeon]|jgi:hypothetical protein|nr:hypothetical protein [Nitrososphaeraceae archaeon]
MLASTTINNQYTGFIASVFYGHYFEGISKAEISRSYLRCE